MVRQYKVTYHDGKGACHAIRCNGKFSTVITVDRFIALGYTICKVQSVGTDKYTR